MSDQRPPTDRPIRDCLQMIGLLSRGAFHESLNAKFTETVEALQALPSGKGKATLTLTIELSCDQDRFDVQPSVKCKLPEDKAFNRTPFWAIDGALSTQHPSQMDMWAPRAVKPTPPAEPAADRA